jgi:hypothetical protein
MKPNFDEFCKGLICEQDWLTSSSQLVIGKANLAHSKNNPNKCSHNHAIPHPTSNSNQTSNDAPTNALNKKYGNLVSIVEKLIMLGRIALRSKNEPAKAKNKSSR